MPSFTTNIRVSVETYERLSELKGDDESFDQVLRRELE